MDIAMRVHRVSSHPVDVDVTFNGETIRATLPELEVELKNDDGHGTQALHFRSAADIKAAKDLFVQGGMVMVSYASTGPAVITTKAEQESAV